MPNGARGYVGGSRLRPRGRDAYNDDMPQPAKSFGRGKPTGKRTPTQRGYGYDWECLRAAHRDEHPLCAVCEAQGIVRLATSVDHIKPFRGIDDPRRLDPGNLQSMCDTHHAEKTRNDNKA